MNHYFQKNQVKEINLKDGDLVISYNKGQSGLLGKEIKKHELQNVKDYLAKTKQNSLTAERLKELNNSSSPKADFPLQVGDSVKIKGCRPLSKTKRFLVIEKEKKM